MSGVEIAGLILGAFPIVIHTLEQYANGVQYVKRFWKYRREFESLIRRLELEVEIFRNTCEELLTGLVPADQITDILNDPAGPAWSDPGVEQLLKKRLQRSHTGYLCTVQNMIAAVEELKVRLRIDRLGEVKPSKSFISSKSRTCIMKVEFHHRFLTYARVDTI
jgi:hypothetical protein